MCHKYVDAADIVCTRKITTTKEEEKKRHTNPQVDNRKRSPLNVTSKRKDRPLERSRRVSTKRHLSASRVRARGRRHARRRRRRRRTSWPCGVPTSRGTHLILSVSQIPSSSPGRTTHGAHPCMLLRGEERTWTAQTRPEETRLDRTGLEQTRPDQTGLDPMKTPLAMGKAPSPPPPQNSRRSRASCLWKFPQDCAV